MSNLHISLTEFKNESRLLKEASSLVAAGVMDRVYVAALHAQGLPVEQTYGLNIYAHRFALATRKYAKNLPFQIVKYLEFCFRIYFYYKSKGISWVNVHSLGLLPLGVALKHLYGARLVYDAHELETEKSGSTGIRKIVAKWLERKLIVHVDLTIVVSEGIADWYSREYSMPRPAVILNAPNRRVGNKRNHFRQKLGIRGDQMILLYQGLLAEDRGVRLILDAFKNRCDDKVVVVFMGYGSLEQEIQNATLQYELIFFYPAVAPSIVLEYTASADVGITLIQNTCLNHYYCMPNKLFEYGMAGLPVLVSDMKDIGEFVRLNRMGIVISDFTPAAINQAIDSCLTMNLDQMRCNAYRAACDHAWEVQEETMLAAYAVLATPVTSQINA